MVWRHGSGSVVLALVLAGCSSFVQADSGSDGDDAGSESGTTDPTVNPPSSGVTDSATSGPGTTPVTSSSDTTGTDPTNATNTDPSDTVDPTTSSTAGETTEGIEPTETTSGTGETMGETGEETTGPKVCDQGDEEDNDTFEDRQMLEEQACEVAASSFDGTLLDETDVDQFEFSSSWFGDTCGNGEPDHVYEPDGPIELCARAECQAGGTTLYCDNGQVGSVNGVPHCCSTDPVRVYIECGGIDESTVGTIVIRADANALVCADYSFTYAVDAVD